MSERRKTIRNIAATAAAVGVAATLAGRVEAKPSPVIGGSNIEDVSGHEQFIPIEVLTTRAARVLRSGEPVILYRGTVKDGETTYFNPVMIPRVKNPKHPNRVASPEYAIGRFVAEYTPLDNTDNIGGLASLRLKQVAKGMKFTPSPNREKGAPILDQVQFKMEPWGLDVSHPTRPNGTLISDQRILDSEVGRRDPSWAVDLVGMADKPWHDIPIRGKMDTS
ncbi:hypothetical protein HYW35_02315 [Candidatus Saccharibacteria bacterium]|nr:hypothetical protein [Candidatus Saccharibacteria bacterium]